MKTVIFDIETGPETAERLALIEPQFSAPSNYKDADKIAAIKAEKREAWLADAALSPLTGRILALGWGSIENGWNISGIGFTDPDMPGEPMTEREIIADFLELYNKAASGSFHLVGFNIHGFDLPFIVRRAMILGVTLPFALRPNGQSRFYWPSCFIDLQQVWGCGEMRPHGSLRDLARLMGLGDKKDSGAEFARLFLDEATSIDAIAYLNNDLILTAKLSERLLG